MNKRTEYTKKVMDDLGKIISTIIV